MAAIQLMTHLASMALSVALIKLPLACLFFSAGHVVEPSSDNSLLSETQPLESRKWSQKKREKKQKIQSNIPPQLTHGGKTTSSRGYSEVSVPKATTENYFYSSCGLAHPLSYTNPIHFESKVVKNLISSHSGWSGKFRYFFFKQFLRAISDFYKTARTLTHLLRASLFSSFGWPKLSKWYIDNHLVLGVACKCAFCKIWATRELGQAKLAGGSLVCVYMNPRQNK